MDFSISVSVKPKTATQQESEQALRAKLTKEGDFTGLLALMIGELVIRVRCTPRNESPSREERK